MDDNNKIFDESELAAKHDFEQKLEEYRTQKDIEAAIPPLTRVEQHKTAKKKRGAGFYILNAIIWMIVGGLITAFAIIPAMFPNAYRTAAKTPVAALPNIDDVVETNLGGALPTLLNTDNPVSEIYANYNDIVVGITALGVTYGEDKNTVDSSSAGTGFFISNDGYILTNEHVVAGANEIMVYMPNGNSYPASYVGGDEAMDIAVLKANISSVSAPFGDSNKIAVGDLAIAIGNPYGLNQILTNTLTVGFISGKNRMYTAEGQTLSYIQTDVALNPGNSGGPLINSKGEVIGVVCMKSIISGFDSNGNQISTEGLGFCIPVNTAIRAAEQIITTGKVTKPGIGISYRTVYETDAPEDSVPGLEVISVVKGGAAEAAGIQSGDIITACDGKSVFEIDNLSNYIALKNVGTEVVFTVYRGDAHIDIPVIIADLNAK